MVAANRRPFGQWTIYRAATIREPFTKGRLGRLEARTTRGSHPLGYVKTAVILAHRHDRERLPSFIVGVVTVHGSEWQL